jgi:hypothetical protein
MREMVAVELGFLKEYTQNKTEHSQHSSNHRKISRHRGNLVPDMFSPVPAIS